MTKKYGVGVVGVGIGRQHAIAFNNHPECKLVAVCDYDTERARECIKELGEGEVIDSYQNLISRNDIDIISIASFDHCHFDQVTQALTEGKHIFVEKPICQTNEEVNAIEALMLGLPSSLVVASNLVLRGAELYKWLRNEIKSGSFGEIYAFDGDYLYGRLNKITNGWRSESSNYSVMHGGGIHLIDLMLWLTSQKPSKVISFGNNISTKNTNFKYNDFVASNYLFSSGLVGRITANFGCVHRHQHVVRIFGTKKTFILDDSGARIVSSRDPDKTVEFLNLNHLPISKGILIPEFVESVKKPESYNGLSVFLDGIRLAIASEKSVNNGCVELVEY